ncbi:hypothetical protein [Myxococcus stipitatus]|uniref:hypothetical protein n=1 Tax=Myxococcus stipitatus TaxID=83455 RepID=UPI0030D3190C
MNENPARRTLRHSLKQVLIALRYLAVVFSFGLTLFLLANNFLFQCRVSRGERVDLDLKNLQGALRRHQLRTGRLPTSE